MFDEGVRILEQAAERWQHLKETTEGGRAIPLHTEEMLAVAVRCGSLDAAPGRDGEIAFTLGRQQQRRYPVVLVFRPLLASLVGVANELHFPGYHELMRHHGSHPG